MERQTYSPSEVAELFTIHVSTVRRLSDEFAPWLSGDATPGKGKARRFRAEDVAIIAYITEQTSISRTLDEIRAELEQGTADIPDASQWEPEEQDTRPALQDDVTAQAFATLAATMDGMRRDAADRASLESRLDDIESQIIALRDDMLALSERLSAYDNASLFERLRGPKR